jgi:hypothetical protein
MAEFTTILGVLFFGCFALSVFITEPVANRIARVVAGVAAAVIAVQLVTTLV